MSTVSDSHAPSRSPIRLTLLTGFLGAGKTTVLNRLLSEPAVTDTAVVVNEFGEVGIDQLLVEAEVSDGLIELSDGCLCCSVRGELVETLERLAERRKDGRPLARVVVETTGLADPTPILAAIMTHPVLSQSYALDAIVCVIDAIGGLANLDANIEARRQLAVADRVLLTKTDLAPEAKDRLVEAVRAINSGADLIEAPQVERLAGRILDCGLSRLDGTPADPERWLGSQGRRETGDGGPRENFGADGGDVHSHGHDGDHHHHRHHDAGHRHGAIRSLSLVHDRPIEEQAVFAFLEMLSTFEGGNVLRMKGVVLTREHPERPLVLHGVRGYLHPPARLPAWREGAVRQSRLVVIGENLNLERVRDLFSAFTGGMRTDAPDRTAIEDNPLAVPGMRFG
ncbi:GTP-binding protein [Fulvimarina endophytica]|uniref:GTP-binding protein n=1 Tax=Fulvimarina endophytica TaxID=2293836 RepID=A0A371X0F0_9HYPH|nr:GTP-binding protein [Fulvimarina endophytica]RFC62718.1 GTP-binding protein [Fulvimarina endophytica]